jgi:hypothetical protein
MKRILLLLCVLSAFGASSQVYNNEWINYSQTYYKFKQGKDGMCRITQPTLQAIGLGSTPSEHFQLWRNGQQVPLFITTPAGALGSTDYIEFWALMNDGHPDSAMYLDPAFQLNKRYSLETDTVSFFLTVNTSGGNLRLAATPNVLPSALAPESFFMYTAAEYYRDKLNPGYAAVVGEYVYSSSYDMGEGPTSTDIAANATKNKTFSNLQPYLGAGAPSAQLKVNVVGNALNPRTVELKVNGTVVLTQAVDFFDFARLQANVNTSTLSGGSASVDMKNISTVTTDRMVIAQVELTYPRLFHFGDNAQFEFELPAAPSGTYLEISGFQASNAQPIIIDFTNGKRYLGDIGTPGLVKVALEPSASPRKMLMISQTVPVTQITSLQPRNFVNYALPANQGDFLIITHPVLAQGTAVEEYKTYRSSAPGGGHNAKVYMIDELTDQFGLGIKKNPSAIRNFLRWARTTYTNPIKNVLLMGKGLTYPQYRAFENNPQVESLSFIPTWGHPASDNLLATDPGQKVPFVSIGRISAINTGEIATYLQKLKQYEEQQAFNSPLIADKAWMKNVVHVIGASDAALGSLLTNHMNGYTNIIKDTFYGGNVHTFSKVSAAPVAQNNSVRLQNLFQEGIGMMTYFGHSSASTLEFNLDNPDQYNNPLKYPVTIVMGCNAGNFFNFNTLRFLTKETLSEKFVLANQRGSIAFIASSHLGIAHYLDIVNTNTYKGASVHKYGQSLGEILRYSYGEVINSTSPGDFYSRFHIEQTTLHGDPAVRLDGSRDKPDYVIEDQLLKVTPNFISVAETHFNLQAKFMNLGKAINRDIVIEVKRTYPDLTTEVIRRDTIPGIRFIDSLNYQIEIIPNRDRGLNKISICIDADNNVEEIYETNNCITRDVFVYENEARPVYPYNLSIVSDPATKLIASTANPFASSQQYVLEVDTTEFFNSSWKMTQTVTSAGGVIEFSPTIPYSDSTVYYWRVAPVPSTGLPVWNTASYVFLSAAGPNASDPGFNQSHFFQHAKSAYQRVLLDSATRKLKFDKVSHNLFLRMGTYVTSGATQQAALSVAIDGIVAIRLTSWFQSLVFNVLDPVSFRPWQNQVLRASAAFPADLGDGRFKSHAPMNASGVLQPYNFEYRYTSPEYRKNAMNFMKDTIPDGHYVVVRNFSLDPNTFGDPVAFPQVFIDQWIADEALYGTGNTLYHYLKNAGFTGIDSFYRVRPWGFVYKKNDPSFAPRWLVGDGSLDNPTLSVDAFTTDTSGFVTSPLFGPALGWKQLKWRGSGEANGDLVKLDVIGVTNNGAETTLFSNLSPAQQDFDVSSINAETYRFVKLRMKTVDSINYTPWDLRYWRITYDPAPEGAIAPNLFLSYKDTVEVGEPVDFKVAFKNISPVPFDSVLVKFVITDRNNIPHIIPIPRRRELMANPDTLRLGADINSATIPGLNTMYIEVNPDNDQPEQYHFNNYAYRSLYVKPDSLDPLLDVTFDGVHILNRDIVSSKPDIVIKLKDEARWNVLDDTALLTLQVRYPNGQLRRFYFNNNDTMQFIPAGTAPNPDNTATINFRPHFLEDGEYELIVTGKDKANNTAGNLEYRVVFEVINKPMISNMLNYPNPFTTSTAFVFTITGHEVPQNIKIEIMTITGRIVREITKDELGPLHIGRNITEFKWDGTDQFGQKLANGIYLYRVVTNLNGKALDKYRHKDDNTDQYFNKGYGKMYLMR